MGETHFGCDRPSSESGQTLNQMGGAQHNFSNGNMSVNDATLRHRFG